MTTAAHDIRVDPGAWADDVLKAVRLTSVGVAIVRAIAHEALTGDGHQVAPGRRPLAVAVGCSTQTAASNIDRLRRLGWLVRVANGGTGLGDRARYRLTFPTPEETP